MPSIATIECEECGEVILRGEHMYHINSWGEEKDDGIDGDFEEGGQCECCGRYLCDDCADWKFGICRNYRKLEVA